MWDIKITIGVLFFTAAITAPKVTFKQSSVLDYQEKLEEVDAHEDSLLYQMARQEVLSIQKKDSLDRLTDSLNQPNENSSPNTSLINDPASDRASTQADDILPES